MLQMMKLTPVESNDFSSFHDKFLKFFLFFFTLFPHGSDGKESAHNARELG